MSEKPVILVTGASSGIGAATARLFGQYGYRIVLAARRFHRLQALAQEIESQGGQALPIATDLSRQADCQHLAQIALEHFGQIDILFNDAGFGKIKWLEVIPPEEVQSQIQVNLVGLAWLTQAVLPHMIARRQGHIINMGSVAAFVATPTYSIYAASKFAVRGFSEALRREVGIHNIHVSLICPGAVDTEFRQVAGIQRATKVTTPKALRLSADDVAKNVLKLALHPRRVLIIPWPMQWVVWINTILPGLLDWTSQKFFVIPERQHIPPDTNHNS